MFWPSQGHAGAVATVLLGEIEGPVGAGEQVAVWFVRHHGGNADTERNGFGGHLGGLHAEPLHHLEGFHRGGVGEDDEELIAAKTSDRIVGTQRFLDAARHGEQSAVAFGVAEAVVDLLESIDVDEANGERHTEASGASYLANENPFNPAPVEGSGDVIAGGFGFDLVQEFSVEQKEQKLSGAKNEDELQEDGDGFRAMTLQPLFGCPGMRVDCDTPNTGQTDEGKDEHKPGEYAEMFTGWMSKQLDTEDQAVEEGKACIDEQATDQRVVEAGEIDVERQGDQGEQPGQPNQVSFAEELLDAGEQEGIEDEGHSVADKDVDAGESRRGGLDEGDQDTGNGGDEEGKSKGSRAAQAAMSSPKAEEGVGVKQRCEGDTHHQRTDVEAAQCVHA